MSLSLIEVLAATYFIIVVIIIVILVIVVVVVSFAGYKKCLAICHPSVTVHAISIHVHSRSV